MPLPILDAASVLLVDTSSGEPRLLMGLRQATNVFLPGKWVFPGGRLETGDADVPPAGALDAGDRHALLARLLPSTPRKSLAEALALAAVRELFEETGHALAGPSSASSTASPAPGVGDGAADGAGVWLRFHALNFSPNIAPLRFIARAITPAGRPRRYDTRFFLAKRTDVVESASAADGEFADLNWFTMGEARALDLPNITRRILADLESLLAAAGEAPGIPFYFEEDGVYRRDLIARSATLHQA